MANHLKGARKMQGWSLREAAAKIGISHEQLRKYEDGIDKFDSKMLNRIAKAYNITVDSIVAERIEIKLGKIKYHNMPDWA